ncbi:6PGD fold domain-containing protein [Corynebacterium otitidis]
MSGPRLDVAVLTDAPSADRAAALALRLKAAGHTPARIAGPEQAAGVGLVLAATATGRIAELPTLARAGTGERICLVVGLDVDGEDLARLSSPGRPAAAVYPMSPGAWLVSAADELSFGVAEVLLNELGLRTLPVACEERVDAAIAGAWRTLSGAVADEARELASRLPGPVAEALAPGDGAAGGAGGTLPLPAELSAMLARIKEPGRARAFVELVRRAAERAGHSDAEWWALQAAGRERRGG